jgi:hypothetical protein
VMRSLTFPLLCWLWEAPSCSFAFA